MSQINLNPVASPVDIFARPGTRLETSAGSDFLQMARSLSKLEPKLAELAGQYDQADRERQIAEGIAFQRDRQLQNMEELQAAVERGDLDENENPWKLTAVKQLVAQRQFRSHAAQVEADLLSDPSFRETDDFTALQTELSTRLTEPFGDIDAFTLRAIQPEAERFIDGYMGRHRSRRLAEREVEALDAFTSGLRDVFSGPPEALRALRGSDDPEVAALSRGVLQRAQATLDAYSRTTSGVKVTQVGLAAVEAAAVSSKDPDTARFLLENLTVGGETLASKMEPGQLQELDKKIVRAQLDEFRLAAAAENARDSALLDQAFGQLEQAQLQGQSALTAELDLTGLSPDARLRVNAFRQKLAEQSAEERFTTASSKLLSGNFSKSDRSTFLEGMFALGYAGQDGINKFRQVEAMFATPTWGENSPATYQTINGLKSRGASVDETLSALQALTDAGAIDEDLFKETLNWAASRSTPSGRVLDRVVRSSLEVAKEQMIQGLRADYHLVDIDGNLDPIASARVDAQLGSLSVKIERYLAGVPQDTPQAEIDANIERMIDDASVEVGGYSSQELKNQFDLIQVRNELSQAGVLEGYEGKLRFEHGRYIMVGRRGTTGPFQGNPRFFDDHKTFASSFIDTGRSLGIAEDRPLDLLSFLEQQIKATPQTDKRLHAEYTRVLQMLKDYTRETEPDRPLPGSPAANGG